jgi:hypothetical protein
MADFTLHFIAVTSLQAAIEINSDKSECNVYPVSGEN